ncbi:MAG: MATE family efflux transporter [Ketobacteraceae bacterium]|nr:MATE family efflux transporter [Ketobacteraceae bacterium]
MDNPHADTAQQDKHPSFLIQGPITRTLTQMTIPTILGIFAILLFNIVDTYFIGLIGPKELAAVSFTFPVSYVVLNISLGIGIGTTTSLSNRLGSGNFSEARSMSRHGIFLAVLVAMVISQLGIVTIDPLFRLLGASDQALVLIREYMVIWYMGIPLLFLPMVGNSAIRATGDTKTPSYIMMTAGLVNGILDPILIFGLGPIPAMGIQGAALATVISWLMASIAVLWCLKVLNAISYDNDWLKPSALASWKPILAIGVPAGATNFIPPIAAGIITRMVAEHGDAAVAGFGVGTRIEAIALVVIMALSSTLTPFIGQNYGARLFHRIRKGLRISITFTVLWELLMTLLLVVLANVIARQFSDDEEVIATTTLFLWCLPISYGCQGVVMLCCSAFNALQKPLLGTLVNSLRLFILAVPAAFVGSVYFGLPGLFIGISIAQVIAAVITLVFFINRFHQLASEQQTA